MNQDFQYLLNNLIKVTEKLKLIIFSYLLQNVMSLFIGFWCYTKDGRRKLKKEGLSGEV